MKLGPYVPDVDLHWEGSGPGPYESVFGKTDSLGRAVDAPTPGVMAAFGFEWQFFYLGGPFGVGLQVAFFRDKAKAIIAEPVPPDESVRSEADSVTFGPPEPARSSSADRWT